ncbi:glycosyltransferase [Sphingobium limneticum]|uniref:glycosyltransferase n=1 Tax=Sphingobium limneticum TaxID=1007511 RepID=UPI003D0052A6
MYWWYLRHGFPEFGLLFDPVDDAGLLAAHAPFPRLPQLGFTPVSWLMHHLADRARLDPHLRLKSAEGQEALLNWFFAKGLSEANLEALLTPEQAELLSRIALPDSKVTRLHVAVWCDAAVCARFPSPDDTGFLAWCRGEGSVDFPMLAHPLIAIAKIPARPRLDARPFGVNLFGHVHARSGVAEDVRMAAKALEAASVPFTLHNVEAGATMADEELGATIQNHRTYAFNLFCMTAPSTAAAASKIGRQPMARHWNIGFWPWELPELPDIWRPIYTLVDEVWASSRYTYEALCRSATRPIRHMPMAVTVDESDGLDRSAFDLPRDHFLFGFAFDGLSTFSRKSPMYCIDAFSRAFPEGNEPAGLVIKAIRVETDDRWALIEKAAASDARIRLIARSLSKGALLDLWRSLDCFVSLHRAEGFGRNIAEAMMLGKPVVVTAHSGNMDFTRHDNAALVPARLSLIQPGDYPFGAGQLWASPDIDEAAARMRRIFKDAPWRDALGTQAAASLVSNYAPDVVGEIWRDALWKRYNQVSDA